jgi:hypothetical protein
MRPSRRARFTLPERPRGNAGNPVSQGTRRSSDRETTSRSRRPPESTARRSKFRFRHWAKRKKTPANEPGQTKPVRVARREALPHSRKGMRILTDYGSAPWRAIPSHPEGIPLIPEGQEDGPARGLDKEYGRWRAHASIDMTILELYRSEIRPHVAEISHATMRHHATKKLICRCFSHVGTGNDQPDIRPSRDDCSFDRCGGERG